VTDLLCIRGLLCIRRLLYACADSCVVSAPTPVCLHDSCVPWFVTAPNSRLPLNSCFLLTFVIRVIDRLVPRPQIKSRACKANTCLASSSQSLLTTTHKTTATNAAPSLRAHMTKKDKTVVEGKQRSQAKRG
jgi:hypothetical protein